MGGAPQTINPMTFGQCAFLFSFSLKQAWFNKNKKPHPASGIGLIV